MADFSPRFNTLVDILEHSSASFRDRPLFGEKRDGSWGWMTYGSFRDEVDRVRTGLVGLGIGKGDVVAMIADNRPEWAIVAYAAYGLGAAVVPMYEAQSVDNWQYIINDSGAKVLFVAGRGIQKRIDEVRDTLPALQQVISFEAGSDDELWFGNLAAGTDEIAPLADVDASDIAGFVYTSGTTGKPKGVLLSHGNLAHNVSAITDVFPLVEDDRSLSFLPWAHAFGQTVELHGFFATGASTAFAESTNQIVANLAEVQPTMLVSVPRIFTRIYDGLQKRMEDEGGVTKFMFDAAISNARKRQALAAEGKTSRWVQMQNSLFDRIVFTKVRAGFGGNIKYAISGGAAIPVEVANFIDALGITVYEGYGLSETSPIATANWPGTRVIGSVGKPIPGVRIELGEADSADPDTGEIIVYGHNVMQGYHNLPEENAKVFTDDGGFRTGDLGHIDADGFLYIVGRVKEQYKLANGKYVVPTMIEEKMSLSPYIANAMVYGDNRPYNIALVVLEMEATEGWAKAQGFDLEGHELVNDPRVLGLIGEEISKTTSGIPRYERIKEFALLSEDFTTENGMLTPTLKVKRPVVLDHFSEDVEKLYG
ncbi:MAG TPA: long-chain fatty acid--CoA ligase [Acidimicrobiia bacterium]|nr:long-chain fatty acid--CoA ligase [Acidimicrobiia bacterium]